MAAALVCAGWSAAVGPLESGVARAHAVIEVAVPLAEAVDVEC